LSQEREGEPALTQGGHISVGREIEEGAPAHADWFRALEREIKEDYDRLHQEALKDPQRAGHGGEGTWARVLENWLPPSYEVVTRKYILPETNVSSFETDIVVLYPSYPKPLRNREEILVGGVAAAFSVKLTLDAAGIRDGVERAVALRHGLRQIHGTARDEMAGPFPVGLLAHSHTWKASGSTPADNVANQFRSLDNELVKHPRESLDYLCVADLGLWWTMRTPYLPPFRNGFNETIAAIQQGEGTALTAISQTDPGESFTAIAALITHLLARLAYTDPTLRPLADNLRRTGTLGTSQGLTRSWDVKSVFSEIVRKQLPNQAFQTGSEFWGSAVF
jgi:hypothetical protein